MSSWLLTLMLLVAPVGRTPAREGAEAGATRYATIAADISAVVEDPAELPVFGGKLGRERTAMLLLAVAYMESGLRVDVDDGRLLGDSGRSCTIFQLSRGRTACAPLLADRRLAAREALRAIRRSAAACPGVGIDGMLRVYASGSCNAGATESAARVRLAQRWFAAHPPARSR